MTHLYKLCPKSIQALMLVEPTDSSFSEGKLTFELRTILKKRLSRNVFPSRLIRLIINQSKTNWNMLFGTNHKLNEADIYIHIYGKSVEQATCFEYLGIILD